MDVDLPLCSTHIVSDMHDVMQQHQNNYAFIDGNNLHLGIKDSGWKLDYKKFRVHLKEKYHVTKAYLFLGYIPENQYMYTRLQENGYVLVFKPILAGKDGAVKGNCDAELVLQAMIDLQEYDQGVLVTGDGDFACLVTYLGAQDKLRIVLAPNSDKCSILLRKAAKDRLVYMNTLKIKLAYINEKAPQ